jgi:hypothetical protein
VLAAVEAPGAGERSTLEDILRKLYLHDIGPAEAEASVLALLAEVRAETIEACAREIEVERACYSIVACESEIRALDDAAARVRRTAKDGGG